MEIGKNNKNKPIKGFRDLVVYQNLYKAMLRVLTEILPKLPSDEKFDLKDQMRRCCKSSPALIAEGFAKRYQKKNWQKYIDDTIGECNEMIHHLSVCIDIYSRFVDKNLCQELIDIYNITSKQLTNLKKSWKDFHENR